MEREFEECIKCAQCCLSLTDNGKYSLPLTRGDARKLRKNKIYRSLLRQRTLRIQRGRFDPLYPFELRAKGPCPFLEGENKKRCLIYVDRPSNCREFTCY